MTYIVMIYIGMKRNGDATGRVLGYTRKQAKNAKFFARRLAAP
jgi:hypothetical protein